LAIADLRAVAGFSLVLGLVRDLKDKAPFRLSPS
jgi:hypothetical protein